MNDALEQDRMPAFVPSYDLDADSVRGEAGRKGKCQGVGDGTGHQVAPKALRGFVMADEPEIDSEIAFGEALSATLLVGALMKRLIQKGLLSNDEVVDLIDQVLLGLEKLQGRDGIPPKVVVQARRRVERYLLSLSPPRRSP